MWVDDAVLLFEIKRLSLDLTPGAGEVLVAKKATLAQILHEVKVFHVAASDHRRIRVYDLTRHTHPLYLQVVNQTPAPL